MWAPSSANGQPLRLDPKSLPVTKLGCRVDGTQSVNLQAGRNQLLVRFDYTWDDHTLGLSLDAAPAILWTLRVTPCLPDK